VPGTVVSIGSVAASSVNVVNANTLIISIPAYISGSLTKDVVVNNGVATATLNAGFNYTPVAPTVSGITPSSGPLAGGSFITIVGSGFTPGTNVRIGAIPATNITVVNSQKITAITPAYQSGDLIVDITVSNTISNATLNNAFTYQSITPTLTSISPSSGSALGGTTVTLHGTGLLPGTTVSVGGVQAANVVLVNVNTLTATVPAYVSGSLVKDVIINNGSGSATLNNAYTYTANAPTLTQVTPNTGSITGGSIITLSGTGFTPSTTISVGGVNATSISITSTSSLTAVVPPYAGGALLVDVTVNNEVSNASLANSFTYQSISPTISNVTPAIGTINGGTSLTITGSGFVPGTTVTIGGIAVTSTTITYASTLLVVTPAYISGSLTKDIIVTNDSGSVILAGGFTYTSNAPVLDTVSPDSGSTLGGTLIHLSGSGFTPGTSVEVGGVSATNVQVISSSQLTAITAAHAVGMVDVAVDNGVGTAHLTNAYEYLSGAPTLTSISPSSGSVAGGITVTLSGTNLQGITAVTIGGVAATGVSVVNNTSVTAVVPAYVGGPLNADVLVSDGSSNASLAGGFSYQGVSPTLSSISPVSSSVVGGVSATVQGSGFIPGTAVSIGGVAATNVVVVNSSTLHLTVPAYINGSLIKDVLVNNGVGSATLVGGFTYTVQAPTVHGVSPSTGSVVGGTLISLTGTGFTPGTTVRVGGIAATNVTVLNSTSLTAITPAYAGGALNGAVEVDNGVSNASLPGAFTYQPIAPAVLSVSPGTGPAAGGTTLTITGSGFVPGMTVSVGGHAASTVTLTSTTTLTAVTPAYVSGSLSKDVVVSNSAGSGSLVAAFTYTAGAPTVGSISPGSGSIAGGTSITINGSGFTPGTTVLLGGIQSTSVTVLNSTTLTALTPAYATGPLVVDVVVDNGVSTSTVAGGFTYQAIVPTLSGSSPASGPMSGGTTLTLSGSGFVPGTTVLIGGVAASNVVITSSTSLTADTPAYVGGALSKAITVNNGEGSVSLNAGFTYLADIPTTTSISPNSGSTGGGTLVTVVGSGFVPGMTISFDGVSSGTVQVLDATHATAVTPAHASGSVDVVVDNGVGSATLSNGYTYASGAPTLSGISPATGSTAGGTSITLTGANLSAVTAVTVGGISASSVVVVDANTVTAVVPAYVSGSLLADVTVMDGSTNATMTGAFTYQAISPTIAAISPNTSSVSGGGSATITGTGFVPGTVVSIGSVAASSVNVVNANTLIISIPAYISGSLTKDVVVNNGVATATLNAGFNYTPVAPTISGITPSSGPLAGGTAITITGSGFTRSSTISIGGYLATGIVFIDSSTITAITPAYINGSLNSDVVVANGVSNATLNDGFTYIASSPTIASITPNEGSVSGGVSAVKVVLFNTVTEVL
jgi:Tfp pilus assembly major pilin PilA